MLCLSGVELYYRWVPLILRSLHEERNKRLPFDSD